MTKIYFFSDYLKEKFGKPLYRVPIDLGLSCPHRNEYTGKGGCIFCGEDGARAVHLREKMDLPTQVEKGINYVNDRYKGVDRYIAYFQTFTSTNAPVDLLREYYSKVLSLAKFSMIIVSTRPDCLPDDVVEYLEELNRQYELWVELGVQTANDETLHLINRQHTFAEVENAVHNLNNHNIKTAAHVIIGLPGENSDDFRTTAKKLAELPFAGIKIHNLLVLKDTPLAKMYHKGQFEEMNEYEYADALVEFLSYLPENWPVMRIVAEADKNRIIAPKWWMKKGQFIEYVSKKIENGGKLDQTGMEKIKTADGSCTFYHPEYKQHFHTLAGARQETLRNFIEPCKKNAKSKLQVLDIGFGLGYNAFEALKYAGENNIEMEIISLELDLKTIKVAGDMYDESSFEDSILKKLLKDASWHDQKRAIKILKGDARKTVKTLKKYCFDWIFLDAFSPDVNPELWTFDFFRILKGIISPEGIIATYSSAYPVRGGLCRCGFYLGETEHAGKRRGGTVASLAAANIAKPISEKEKNIILRSTIGVAYRDSGLCWTRQKICEYRKKIVYRLRQKGIPKWYSGTFSTG